jgi:dTDP-4-dehydrorhamnose 3,5-epimerase
MPFKFEKTEIPEVMIITPQVFEDDRGFFLESYHYTNFHDNGITNPFVQENHSKSIRNVLRGLHFQKNSFSQGKLVRCTKGNLLDVAVDIRPDSPTFKKYVMVELSAKNKKMLWIPAGLAHGFLALSDNVELQYKCDNYYRKEADAGIIWNDSEINIPWPVIQPILSEKDRSLPTLQEYLNKITIKSLS